MNSTQVYSLAAASGAVAGLRSMMAPALTGLAVEDNAMSLKRTPFALLGTGNVAHSFLALAAGELIADKLPFIPNRTSPPALIARFVSGASAGAALCAARKKDRWVGAALGGAGAVAAAFAGFKLRQHAVKTLGYPDLAVAVIEDCLAIGCGLAIVGALKRG